MLEQEYEADVTQITPVGCGAQEVVNCVSAEILGQVDAGNSDHCSHKDGTVVASVESDEPRCHEAAKHQCRHDGGECMPVPSVNKMSCQEEDQRAGQHAVAKGIGIKD